MADNPAETLAARPAVGVKTVRGEQDVQHAVRGLDKYVSAE
jgi:hypothetical protein